MSKMRKIALIGIVASITLAVVLGFLGYPPVIGGIHAMPFCMLLIIDISRKKTE